MCATQIALNTPELSNEARSVYAESLWVNATSLGPVEAARLFHGIYRDAMHGPPQGDE